jgi:hypothetical protein
VLSDSAGAAAFASAAPAHARAGGGAVFAIGASTRGGVFGGLAAQATNKPQRTAPPNTARPLRIPMKRGYARRSASIPLDLLRDDAGRRPAEDELLDLARERAARMRLVSAG